MTTTADRFWEIAREGGPLAALASRFLLKVDRDGPVAPGMDTPCWVWMGWRFKLDDGSEGYGGLSFKNRSVGAHRVAWMLSSGEETLPALFVCHRCDNKACVRPDHLWLGTNAQNISDAYAKGRATSPFRTQRFAGERHGCAKLTAIEADAIRESTTQTPQQLAGQYGVHPSTVRRIRAGHRWGPPA